MSFKHLMSTSLMMLFVSVVQAEERNVALMASACAACHGTHGHSAGGTPSLAGLERLYFIQQMQLFQTGERPSSVMMKHARGYTKEEIRLLADYFSARK
jgi:cytochrome c553